MNSRLLFVPALLATIASVAACSGGDDDGTGTGGGAGTGGATGGSSGKGGSAGTGTGGSAGTGAESAIMAACRMWCEEEDHCKETSTVADCMEYTCTDRAINPSGNIEAATMACQNAYKAYWTCLIGSGDECTTPGPCETQAAGLSACVE